MTRILKLLAVLLLVPMGFAQELGPEELVKRITAEVLDAITSDKQLAAGDRQKAIKLAEQKKQLVSEFRAMLVRTYSNAISAYEGQTMKVMPVRMKPGDHEVTVRNQFIRPGGRPVLVDYSMRKGENGWKIFDIVVEGVSLVITYRSEFDAIVKQEGVDALIKRLSQKNTPAVVGGTKK